MIDIKHVFLRRKKLILGIGIAVIAVVGVGFSVQIRREIELTDRVRGLGGWYEWDWLGVGSVEVDNIDDAQLTELAPKLEKLWCLKSLALSGRITDEGIKSIENLAGLRWLYIRDSLITDK